MRLRLGQGQLETALRNLLLNASHAAGEQCVIRLGVAIDGPDLILRVEDSGAGFGDAQALSRIGTRLAWSWGGQGLGLLIVRRVVEEADGSLSVGTSRALGGACVMLRLPRKTPGPFDRSR